MKSLISASLLVVAASASPAAAFAVDPIDWVTDIRRCIASFSGNGSGSSWQDRTVPFGAYEGGADILVANGVETWSANCTQESTMDGASASFSARSNAVIIAGLMSNALSAQSQAKFDLYFTIVDPMEYRLEGEVTESNHSDSMSTVRLSQVGGDVIESVSSSTSSSRVFHMSGVLQPGTYRLYAEALGKCRTLPMIVFAEGHATCRMDFSVMALPDSPVPPPRPTTTSSTDSPPPRR